LSKSEKVKMDKEPLEIVHYDEYSRIVKEAQSDYTNFQKRKSDELKIYRQLKTSIQSVINEALVDSIKTAYVINEIRFLGEGRGRLEEITKYLFDAASQLQAELKELGWGFMWMLEMDGASPHEFRLIQLEPHHRTIRFDSNWVKEYTRRKKKKNVWSTVSGFGESNEYPSSPSRVREDERCGS
jgi:hypothetical protein